MAEAPGAATARAERAVHLDLDGAWGEGAGGLETLALRHLGPRLRYCAPQPEIEALWRQVEGLSARYVLYGSGDFHHLAAVLARRVSEPVTLVAFDNHPDWDVRPPRWACGGWVNRALELPAVERVSVWGCSNFELALPARAFADHRALRAGRLEVHPWHERLRPSARRRFAGMTREDWTRRFERLVAELAGRAVYVTVDLDCLRAEEAATNWESGLFTAGEVAWALRRLHERARVVGGDLCGAYSPPAYARLGQRLAAGWDHPRPGLADPGAARRRNRAALARVWPALTGEA